MLAWDGETWKMTLNLSKLPSRDLCKYAKITGNFQGGHKWKRFVTGMKSRAVLLEFSHKKFKSLVN